MNTNQPNQPSSRIERLLNLTQEQLIVLGEEVNDHIKMCAKIGDVNLHNLAIEELEDIRLVYRSRSITNQLLPY